jgi:hypothetical protein
MKRCFRFTERDKQGIVWIRMKRTGIIETIKKACDRRNVS